MNNYLVTVTVIDPDTGKYNIEIPVQAKTAAHAKRIAHSARRPGRLFVKLSALCAMRYALRGGLFPISSITPRTRRAAALSDRRDMLSSLVWGLS